MKIKSVLKIIVLLSFHFIFLTCPGQSQTDSSVVANKDLRQAAILIEEGKGYYRESLRKENAIDSLQFKLNNRDVELASYRILNRENKREISSLSSQLLSSEKRNEYQENIINQKDEAIQSLYKSIQKKKKKTCVITMVAVGLITFLIIKK